MKDLLIEMILTAIKRRMNQGCEDITLFFKSGKGHNIMFSLTFREEYQAWYMSCGDTFRPASLSSKHPDPRRALVVLRQQLRHWKYGWNHRDYDIYFSFPDDYQFEIIDDSLLPSFLTDTSYPKTKAMYREEGIHINYGYRRNRQPYSSIAYK